MMRTQEEDIQNSNKEASEKRANQTARKGGQYQQQQQCIWEMRKTQSRPHHTLYIPQPTTHNKQCTTHNTQHTSHNTHDTAHITTQHTTHHVGCSWETGQTKGENVKKIYKTTIRGQPKNQIKQQARVANTNNNNNAWGR